MAVILQFLQGVFAGLSLFTFAWLLLFSIGPQV
jgi:hypothetical protein